MAGRAVPKHAESGALMIEILVAMLLLSLGLLAMAGLQRASMQAFGNSRRGVEASMVAHNLAEKIRAYPEAASAGLFDDERRAEGRDRVDDSIETHLERGTDRKHPWLIRLSWDEPLSFAEAGRKRSNCDKGGISSGAGVRTAAKSESTVRSCMTLEFMP